MGGGIDYKEESHVLKVNKEGGPITTTIFTYDEDHNFSGFWFYKDNDNVSYIVNDKGEIVSSNSACFRLESDTVVRRVDLNNGEVSETQDYKNEERMIYIAEEASVGDTLILYNKDTLEITKCSDPNWVGKYYVEFNKSKTETETETGTETIQLVVNSNLSSIIYSNPNNSGYSVVKDDTVIERNSINFNITDNENKVVYVYRSRDINEKEFIVANIQHTLLSAHLTPKVINIGNFAFSGCVALTKVYISYGVETIGTQVFSGCSGLTQVDIPCSVTKIGGSAFTGCKALEEVTIRNSAIEIGNSAFFGCGALEQIIIPYGITSIGDGVFRECGLTQITIPNTVTSIGATAFYDCKVLKQITIPNNVTFIGNNAFNGCEILEQVIIPYGITSINTGVFRKCGLKQITIPNNVTFIGNNAFQDCKVLEQVTIPNSVIEIGISAFQGCIGLTKVVIPNSVTTIKSNAFSDCSELTQVTIPNTIETIVNLAFINCNKIETINISNYKVGAEINGTIISIFNIIKDTHTCSDTIINNTITYTKNKSH